MSASRPKPRSWIPAAAIVAGALVAMLALGCTTSPSEEEETAFAPEPPEAEAAAQPPIESEEAPAPPRRARRALRVARVIDGDTFELDTGERVRLVQIDAPEAKGECFGRKAGSVLRRLLPVGSRVRIARDHGLDDVDRYGRLLRYVFRGGRNVNLLLVKRGAASVWFYRGDRGRYAGPLLRAAEAARAAGRGAWGACEANLDPFGAFQTRHRTAAAPPAPVPATASPASGCHPFYEGACLDPGASDYDCAGGSGNGPEYVPGPVSVVGPDDYELDADGDGVGCEG